MENVELIIEAIEKRQDISKAEYELEGEERELMEKIYPGFRRTAWDKLQAFNEAIYLIRKIAPKKNKKESSE